MFTHSYSGFSQKPLTENDGADPGNLLLWVNRRLTGNCYLINSPELLERVEENQYRQVGLSSAIAQRMTSALMRANPRSAAQLIGI
jgi:hypothetical protein